MQKKYWILLVFLLLPQAVQAQTGTCEPALGEAYLDAGNVRARILNNGGLFWRGSPHVYEVPKGEGRHAVYNTNVWIGGLINKEVRTIGTRYGDWEFWAGPLDAQGNPPPDCKPYDKIWEIRTEDIQTFIDGKGISNNLKNWPWQLGAPVVDGDGNPNNYNLEGGDLPELLGDQRLWWIMNDRGNIHEVSGSKPIGLEVHASVHAYAHAGPVANITFYSYKLINKNEVVFSDVFFGLLKDIDLGNFGDDYIGSDSLLHLGYTYNADNFDDGDLGYGSAPPAVGVTFLESIPADDDGIDNNRDGQVDESNEQLGAYGMIYNAKGGFYEPYQPLHYYTILQAKWRDGSSILEGLTGFDRDLTDDDFPQVPRKYTRFMYPGDPVSGAFWTQLNYDNQGSALHTSDRGFIISTGSFDIAPEDTAEVKFAIVWSRGTSNLDSVTELKKDVQAVRDLTPQFYSPTSLAQTPNTIQAPVLGFDQNFPNPFSQTTTLRYSLPQPMQVRLTVHDLLGREVALLVDAQQEAGIHTAEFDAGSLPAGVYLARIELDFLRFTRRMVLLQ